MNDFPGFPQPTKNFFSLPNEIIDIIAEITNLSELKVLLYIIRHTWGYQEFGIGKTISVDEFMHGRRHSDGSRMDHGTGLKSDRSVRDGIELAVKHGYLICEVDHSDKARTKKSYALKMRDVGYKTLVVSTTPVELTGVVDTTTPVSSTGLGGRYYQSEGQNLPPRPVVSTSRSEKETLERNSRKTLEERKSESPGSSPPSALSLTHSSHSDISFSSDSPLPDSACHQGGVIPPPASVKGESLDASSVPNESAEHTIMQQPSESVACSLPDLLIVVQTDTTAQDGTPHVETPDSGASSQIEQQIVAVKSTTARPTSRRKKEVQPPTMKDLLAAAPADVQAVLQEWCGIFTRPIGITQALLDQATILAAFKPDPGEIAACRLWMYKTDTKKWYSTHGMNLAHVAKEFERFRSLDSIPGNQEQRAVSHAKPNNQEALQKVQRLLAEKKAREATKNERHTSSVAASAKTASYVGV